MTITATQAIRDIISIKQIATGSVIHVTPSLWQQLWCEQADESKKAGGNEPGDYTLWCQGCRIISRDKGYGLNTLNRYSEEGVECNHYAYQEPPKDKRPKKGK